MKGDDAAELRWRMVRDADGAVTYETQGDFSVAKGTASGHRRRSSSTFWFAWGPSGGHSGSLGHFGSLREAKDACQRARRREVDPQRRGGGGAATRRASPRTFEVFRGDRARIQRFDEREIKRGEYGRGFYFVDDVGVADGYGPVVDAYLVTLRAPYEMRQFGGWLRELAALVGEAAPSGIDARSRWVTEKLRGLGYDGIVVKMATGVTYVVAFDPDQIARVEERPQPRIPQAEPVRAKVRVRGWEPAF